MDFSLHSPSRLPLLFPFLGIPLSFYFGLSNSIVFYELLPKDPNADIIVFYQPSCPHCIAEVPVIRELVAMGYRVSAFNVLKHPDIARAYGVTATPTIYIPSTGVKLVGEQDLNSLLQALEGMEASEGEACSVEEPVCYPT